MVCVHWRQWWGAESVWNQYLDTHFVALHMLHPQQQESHETSTWRLIMFWQVKCRWGLLPVGGACMTSHGQVLMTLVVWYKVLQAVAHSRGVITKPEAQTTYPEAAAQLPEASCHQFRNSNPYKVIKFFVLWWKRYKFPQLANTYSMPHHQGSTFFCLLLLLKKKYSLNRCQMLCYLHKYIYKKENVPINKTLISQICIWFSQCCLLPCPQGKKRGILLCYGDLIDSDT